MSISLSKGTRQYLSRKVLALTKVFHGLWVERPAQTKEKGLFGSLLGGGCAEEIDLGAWLSCRRNKEVDDSGMVSAV